MVLNQDLNFFSKNATCTHGCGLYIESFTVQYCARGIITQPVFWLGFVT